MTIQIIYAEIFHNVLRKIPGHTVGGWLCDLEASLWFLKFRPWLCILLSFTCRHSIFSDWSFILFPWLFHCFWLLQKCCCLSKFQEESFWQDIPSVNGPVNESSPLCKYRRRCMYCLYLNQAQDSLFLSNLISSKWIPNNVQITIQLYSFHMLARLCSKSFKLGFSSTWTKNFCCRSWV